MSDRCDKCKGEFGYDTGSWLWIRGAERWYCDHCVGCEEDAAEAKFEMRREREQ